MGACDVLNAVAVRDALVIAVCHAGKVADADDVASRNVHVVQHRYFDPCRLKNAHAYARLAFRHCSGPDDVSTHLAADVQKDGARDGIVVGALCCFAKPLSSGTLSFGHRSGV